nr:flavodoxin [Rhodococcus sp. (in: high G+C Gram-positive bacteria)]
MTRQWPRVGTRRAVLRGVLALGTTGVSAAVAGCSNAEPAKPDAPQASDSQPTSAVAPRQGSVSRVLLAFFSRPGENYYYGDRTVLDVGNTEVLVGMITERIACDVHRIEPLEAYPFEYEATVERNRAEQRNGSRPTLVDPVVSLDDYDTVILACPVWNSSAPMVMRTFTERLDFAGKTLYPATTHAVSGLSGVPAVYRESCEGAIVGAGLAVQGEDVRDAEDELTSWLQRTGLQ